MAIISRFRSLRKIIAIRKYYLFFLLFLFFLILAYFFITWPIVMTDTDLWYHLSGGRYFWQEKSIANDAFFSYIQPPKDWYNYYWLFQVIIYKIYQATDYYGLILLRGLLYLVTALFICFCLLRRARNHAEILIGLLMFIGCTVVIMYRELLVRPHLFSYLFIVVFLYVLEFKRDKIWLLPILGIVWSNVHGIEYPVMFLIVFAYLLEIYWNQFRKIPATKETGRAEKWLLISVFYTIFITPGVIKLVQIPFSVSFQTSAYQHLYVAELLPIPVQNFFIYTLMPVQAAVFSIQNIIIILVVCSFLLCVWKREMRISHVILLIGALLLVVKHTRFTYEFTLLSIPLLSRGVSLAAQKDWFPRRFMAFAVSLIVVLLPLLMFHNVLKNRPAYPFSESNLPTGVARFLINNASDGGKILNEPNTGGYLPWALGDKFKIYMDMQMSLFSDTDFATAINAFSDENVFRAFIKKYEPSFISVSLHKPYFRNVIAGDKRFIPVFFDHAELLYVNKDSYGNLVKQFELKAIDPFHYQTIDYEELGENKLAPMFAEASGMWKSDPANYAANHILGSIAIVRKQYDRALHYAETILQHYPEQAHGYALKGDALFGMEKFTEAALLYEKALDMSQNAKHENVYWNLHASYVKLKKYKEAYQVLSKYVNPFNPATDYKEIYQLGISAASVGKTREAVTFLNVAKMKAPPSDTEYIQKIDMNLAIQSGRSP